MFTKDNFPTFPIIPPITNGLGRHWKQPTRVEIKAVNFILKDGSKHHIVEMPKLVFNKLELYATSQPSGLYEGKMWRTKIKNGKFLRDVLCFVIDDPQDKSMCFIHKCYIQLV